VDLHTPSPADPPTLINARNRIKAFVTARLAPTQEELDAVFGSSNQTTLFLATA
jgi:hypothetical protein